MPVIDAQELGCKIGYRYVLKEITWQVNKGEHWVVFGQNGCGKTTLLSIIAGYYSQTQGELSVFGEPYSQQNILAFRQKIGFISSSFFDKTLSDESALNIVLSGKFGALGIRYAVNDCDIRRAKALLGELRLAGKINRPFNMMSKGERQNVLIARALMGAPEILVLDEPGTGLDVFAREYLLSTVQDLAANTEMTIIYVTHYTEEILPCFDKCLLLKAGRVYQQGATKTLFADQTISDLLDYPVQIISSDERLLVKLEVDSKLKEML